MTKQTWFTDSRVVRALCCKPPDYGFESDSYLFVGNVTASVPDVTRPEAKRLNSTNNK